MKPKTQKFKLADDNRKGQQADETGTVVVKIYLASKGHQGTKGNVVRTVRLKDCRVSEVHGEFLRLLTEEPQ